MEELIKETESLYWQIDKVIWNLIATRENKDDEGKKKSISDMETVMCGTQQFLKCIIDRKDNIVDLGEVWHGKEIKPEENSEIVIIDDDEDWVNISYRYKDYDDSSDKGWEYCVLAYDIAKWAYLKDLLPKGGD